MNQFETDYSGIYKKILRAHRKYFGINILKSSLFFVLLACGYLFIWLGINLLFEVSSLTRYFFFGLLLAGFFLYSVFRILPALREIFSPSDQHLFRTAKKIGIIDETVQDSVLNYIQIYNNRGSHGSDSIKKLALQQLSARISGFSFRDDTALRDVNPYLRWLLIPALLTLLVLLFLPAQTELAFGKLFLPWKNYLQPFPVTLVNESGNMEVLKNDPVTLVCSSQGVRPDKLFLVIEELKNKNSQSDTRIEIPVRLSGRHEYELPHVSNSFRYRFIAELNQTKFRNKRTSSEESVVEVRERPVVRTLQLNVIPPSYTGLEPDIMDPNDGEITAYRGSQVRISIETDKQLSSAFLLFEDSSSVPLSVVGHTGKGQFKLEKNTTYSIRIFDSDSIPNSNPVTYGIFLLNDEYPFAEIKTPGADVDLGDELTVPMLIELQDDFGFSGLKLKGSVFRQGSAQDSTSFEMKIPFEIFERGKALSEFNWDLTSFYLVPDDFIQYHAEVMDNDRITGPKSYSTRAYTIRLPSILEVLARSEQAQQEQLEQIDELAGESKELREKLEEINREMKKESEVNWERQQEIKKQLEKHSDISEKLSEIRQKMDEVVKELDQNEVLSPEALQKYMELQEMFQELAPEEMKKTMQDIQEALEKADLNQLKKSMEKFEMSMQEFEKSIERFHELFKRVRLEQKMDELIRLAEKLNQEQTEINEKLNDYQISDPDFERLEKKEENIGRNAEFLEEEMKQADSDYREVMKNASEMLEKAREFMNEQKIQDKIENMQQQLGQMNQQQSSQSGQDLKSGFEMLQSMLQTARNDMMSQQQQEIAGAMQKAMQDMLDASFDQETLAQRSQNLSPASPQVNDIARQQSRLMSNTNQLIQQLMEIAKQTFMLSPELNKNMAQALSNMGQSIRQLEERNPRQAYGHQMQAMAGFNEALMSLQNSMNQMSQSGSPSGFQDFMEQLQKMAGQQGALNQESMSLFRQQGGSGRPQLSEDALARLAAQQEMIRQSLQQAMEGTGSRRDVLGRMEELGAEMEEVVKELKERNLDRRVIERQERILSRLLDAQKSVREKEYSRKREAEREEIQLAKSPPELRKELLQQRDRLQKELRDALEEGYTQEYRELIKDYFEFLSRHPELLRQQ